MAKLKPMTEGRWNWHLMSLGRSAVQRAEVDPSVTPAELKRLKEQNRRVRRALVKAFFSEPPEGDPRRGS